MIVEPTPVDVTPATGPAYQGTRAVPATPLRSPSPPAPALLAPGPAHATMDLQRRAPRNLRRHLERATVRLLVLVTADLAAYQRLQDDKLTTLPGVQRMTSTLVSKRIVQDRPLPG